MNLELARFNMLEQQIRTWGVLNSNLLDVLAATKRENFVDNKYKDIAFSDMELPLPGIQKMLSPKVEARMLQELTLNKQDNVLEIGTGSGYVTAVLSKMSNFVYSVEINELNKELAVKNLMESGITNAKVILGDGVNGLSNHAPYDKIFVGGALTNISDLLKSQLKIGGVLVGIVGYAPIMNVVIIRRITEDKYDTKYLFEVIIDYLLGENDQRFNF